MVRWWNHDLILIVYWYNFYIDQDSKLKCKSIQYMYISGVFVRHSGKEGYRPWSREWGW